jgi:hypothetical protein
MIVGPPVVEGVLWLVEHKDPISGFERCRYVYGPVGATPEEPPCHLIGQHDVVIERIPWALMAWNEIEVHRSSTWWDGLQPKLAAFWDDVERARLGEFVVPAARARKMAVAGIGLGPGTGAEADEECLIKV